MVRRTITATPSPPRRRPGLSALAMALLAAAACSNPGGTGDEVSSPTDADAVVAEAATDGGRPGRGDDQAEESTDGPVDADAGEGSDVPADTLVWLVSTEPPDLHLDDPANGLTITSWIREGLLESLFGVGPDLTYHPELLAAEPTITPQEDASVVIAYRLRPGLTWSDGTPLTADDVAYTHRIITEGCQVEGDGSILDNAEEGCVYQTTTRVGYDQVTSFEVVNDTDFNVTMAGFYPDWRRLYGPVLAAHAHGDDAGQVNRRLRTMTGSAGPLPSSGPLRFERWDQGRSMRLVANEAYHGSTAPNLENDGPPTVAAVRIDFEPDPEARIEALLEGRADLMLEPIRSDGDLVDAAGISGAVVLGLDYDHWGLNLLNPHLATPEVREAIALAIDKAALVEAVYGPILGATTDEARGVPIQDNTYWLANQPAYVATQGGLAAADVEQARARLVAAGYEPASDGLLRHPTLGPLRLRVTTIGGDRLRETGQQVLIDQLAAVGIEAVADNPSGGRFFQQGPFAPEALAASASGGEAGDPDLWDIAQFGWVGGPWPGAQSGVYRNGSPGNPYGFSNAEFEVRAFECDAVIDDEERAGCYNELDRFVTTVDNGDDGLFMIPLHQRPLLLTTVDDRVEAMPSLTGAPRGGPLAVVVDVVLAEG